MNNGPSDQPANWHSVFENWSPEHPCADRKCTNAIPTAAIHTVSAYVCLCLCVHRIWITVLHQAIVWNFSTSGIKATPTGTESEIYIYQLYVNKILRKETKFIKALRSTDTFLTNFILFLAKQNKHIALQWQFAEFIKYLKLCENWVKWNELRALKQIKLNNKLNVL